MKGYDVIVAGAGPAGSTAAALLARHGCSVLLVDRQRFPRQKTCAGWVNRLAFERFDYLRRRLDTLVETPFSGITFLTADLRGRAAISDERISGYLTLRDKFDDGLRRAAEEMGAEFRDGTRLEAIEQGRDGVVVTLCAGSGAHTEQQKARARVLVGADGANSRVAVVGGLRPAWSPQEYALCANEDIPADPARVRAFYGQQLPLLVAPRFAGVQGYGWIFAKRRHISVGIGGRMPPGIKIRELFCQFVSEARRAGLLLAELVPRKTAYALDPAGAVHRGRPLARGRVLLVGDAGGFVSGSTGEGIYPGMVSAEVAAEVIRRALSGPSPEAALAAFQQAWKRELDDYLRPLPGGDRVRQTQARLDLVFRYPWVARIAARAFLYGEPLSLRTALRAW